MHNFVYKTEKRKQLVNEEGSEEKSFGGDAGQRVVQYVTVL